MDDDEYDEELMSSEGNGNGEKNQEQDAWFLARRRRRRRRIIVITIRRRRTQRRRGTIRINLNPVKAILKHYKVKINKGITGLRRSIFICCKKGRKKCFGKWFCFLGRWWWRKTTWINLRRWFGSDINQHSQSL